jgi:hypothetical protein
VMKLASGPSRNAATERPRPWWRPVEPATLRSSVETPVPFRVQLRLASGGMMMPGLMELTRASRSVSQTARSTNLVVTTDR